MPVNNECDFLGPNETSVDCLCSGWRPELKRGALTLL
jgi:hypothetical protein